MEESGRRKPVAPMMFPSQLARHGPGSLPEAGRPQREGGLEISVGSKEGSEPPRVYVFRQSKITVGRSSACELRLDDPERLASGRHAEISVSGDRALVKDLGSRNSTFLNGERLEPEAAVGVGPQDEIVISGAWLRVRVLAAGAEAVEAPTVLAPGSANPFAEEARFLAEALRRIAEIFDAEAPESRARALEEALRKALGDESGEAYAEIGRLLGRSGEES